MDMVDALNLWKSLGNTTISWNAKDAYYILFIKDDEVVGNIKTVAGGIFWDWPEDLMTARRTEKV